VLIFVAKSANCFNMKIANPIYDTVFKYLMEDLEIAKGLLSAILDREVVELSMRPQETTTETQLDGRPVRVYRIDFAAVLRLNDGTYKKVLIELQKTQRSTNILRFRRYLAENYSREDTVVSEPVERYLALEIVTIYFLGFNLESLPVAVLRVNNCFWDVTAGLQVYDALKEDFIRLLNHESFVIQIRRLPLDTKTRLERVLSVFNQAYRTPDHHFLDMHSDSDDPLVKRMLNRLTRAVSDEGMRRKMDVEDEFEREYEMLEALVAFKDEQLKGKDEQLKGKDEELKGKDEQLKGKDEELKGKDEELKGKDEQLKDKNEQLEKKDWVLKQRDQDIQQRDQEIQQRDQDLLDKDRYIQELLAQLNKKTEE
jgi:hypothetical protein